MGCEFLTGIRVRTGHSGFHLEWTENSKEVTPGNDFLMDT